MFGEWRLQEHQEALTKRDDQLVRHLIRLRMQMLQEHGVIPTWQNFSHYGDGWAVLREVLTAEEAFRYKRLWDEMLRETWPSPTP